MNLEFGFTSICRSEQECSPEGNVTARQLESLDDDGERRYRIERVARQNLENTMRIMWFLRAHDVYLYRLSPNMIPLALDDMTADWAWWEDPDFVEIGERIGGVSKESGYRLSAHLPRVCGLAGAAAFRTTKQHLEYYERLFGLLDLDAQSKIILQVGGQARTDKSAAMENARKHIEELSDWARERIVLENGDRTFALEEIVKLGEDTGVPITFNWQNHWLNHEEGQSDEEVVELLHRAFDLWQDRPPKVHVSSPRSEKQPRLFSDHVDIKFSEPFWELLEKTGAETIDVMIEARMKDIALFKLREHIKERAAEDEPDSTD